MHGLSETYRVYLAPAEFVDSDQPAVRARVRELTHIAASDRDKAIALFTHVRDLRYGAPDFDRLESFKASTVLREGGGYCVPKASAFVALCRASNIPARLAFADVTNHLATPRTLESWAASCSPGMAMPKSCSTAAGSRQVQRSTASCASAWGLRR